MTLAWYHRQWAELLAKEPRLRDGFPPARTCRHCGLAKIEANGVRSCPRCDVADHCGCPSCAEAGCRCFRCAGPVADRA